MTKEEKQIYLDRLNERYADLSRIKTEMLETQGALMDEDFFTNDLDEKFEEVDDALATAKAELNALIYKFTTNER